ncbi:hypothetical protein N7532_001543 [Penicillium argentinense]|uniref:Uncharacterized protein n=1 Tax=Penicillium argentinense TaxID=1131581 RepID=A0A9W9G2S9_9EURO|nr:uncharacterized protein N7532_001543 [Penicillium argentinense]KAJ5111008.1 hypothetical protein N7532_001543 [Penicillium argentinense]
MADSNPSWQGRPGQKHPSPPNANSPLSPASGGSNPISFRPNVNRAKTKRWVEAKQYSYDGGDWGSEEEEEEEEEQPPAVPRPPYATERTTSSSELSSRRLSGIGFGGDESRGSPSTEVGTNPAAGDQKNLPFVRPADIYRRMDDRSPQQDATTSPKAPEPMQSAAPGAFGATASTTTQNAPSMGLPEVKRISGFGTDFLSGTDFNQQTPSSEQPPLQHNPSQASDSSQGFRSVVHQAFDVPETPNSTAGSVARSNSDGTSVISPIMGHRAMTDDKTPTIPEEPPDTSTPTAQDGAGEAPFFKPGHRRDMSLPERDNSPSRRPVVTDHEAPSAGQAEIASVSPGQENRSPERPADNAGIPPTIPPSQTHDGAFVAPLKFGSAGTSTSEGYRGSIPTIVGANTSPDDDADNDRLREEIIRSLSRENSQEPEEQPQTEGSREKSIPNQYEKSWDGQTGPSDETPRQLVSESHPDWASTHPLASRDPYAAASQEAQSTAVEQPTKPKLGRRFSWESSSSGEPAQNPSIQVPHSEGLAAQAPEPIADGFEGRPPSQGLFAEAPVTDGEVSGSESHKAERPRLSIVPPVSQSTTPPEQIIPAPEGSQRDLTLPANLGSSSIDETKLQGFREILTITTPGARIRAFDETRNQFAALDTGLNHWLQVTLRDQPQHSDLVQASQNVSSGFPKASPTTRRFPKLPTLGNLAASREDGTPTNPSHIRRPSGHIGTIVNRQNVEQRGKDFLHTAGTFGGKAGEAAKGLFAKGRSKFRQGGNDKVQSPSARKSLQFQFSFQSDSPNSTGHSGKKPRRNSLNFNSLPVFKFGREDKSSTKDPASIEDSQVGTERWGKRPKSNGTLDLFRWQNENEENNSKGGGAGDSDLVSNFEQEMNTALGLSPTETRAQQTQPAIVEPAQPAQWTPRDVDSSRAANDTKGLQPPSRDESAVSSDEAEANTYLTSLPLGEFPDPEKDLPLPPSERTDDSASSDAADLPSRSGVEVSHTTIPSIRAVPQEDQEDLKPQTPPKDLQPKGNESKDLPLVPPKDDLPENPLGSQGTQGPSKSPQHALRLPSVSTLGEKEKAEMHSSEEQVNTPPSPVQAATDDKHDPEPEAAVYGKAIAPASVSRTSLPHDESGFTGLDPLPLRAPSSQEILEFKRRSISGLPPSAPGVQSPLRNEVRYSPGTRSSMMSFGSFGRRSTGNSKGTRPNTPGNDLAQQSSSGSAQNGESKMDKLKEFGRRRRASVGYLLTGIQGELQGGIQGLQEKSQKKRTFSRISGFFGRQQDSQPSESKVEEQRKTDQGPLDVKALPTLPNNNRSSYANGFTGKSLPLTPPVENGNISTRSSIDRPRASISGPPTASSNPMGGSRFYSQLMSGETQANPQHTRSRSQPLMMGQPLSPVAPSVSESDSNPSPPLPGFNELEEQLSPKEVSPPPSVPPKSPQLEQSQPQEQSKTEERPEPNTSTDSTPIRSRKPLDSAEPTNNQPEPKNIVVSGSSLLSNHPTRDSEARMLNETEPVELALKDDSSEEIVMSPTAYPGQEWTPMHY